MRFAVLLAAVAALFGAQPATAATVWNFKLGAFMSGTLSTFGIGEPTVITPVSDYYREVDGSAAAFLGDYNWSTGGTGNVFSADLHYDGTGLTATNFRYFTYNPCTGHGCYELLVTAPNPTLTFVSAMGGPAPVPEPATWALMLVGFGAIGWAARHHSRQGAQRSPKVS